MKSSCIITIYSAKLQPILFSNINLGSRDHIPIEYVSTREEGLGYKYH